MPLALVIEGANRHDMKLAIPTLDAQDYARPDLTMEQPQHLCLDAGYNYDSFYGEMYLQGYEPLIRLNPRYHCWYHEAMAQSAEQEIEANPLESTKKLRRWVTLRLFS